MPRAKRTDFPRRTELNLSEAARMLLDRIAVDISEEEYRPVQWSEVVEKAIRLLAKRLGVK